jgi:2-methylisocitrate lyase-like PEP mutase family enzyme
VTKVASTPAREALRDLLASGQIVLAPGIFDGISAQLVRRTGHSAAYLTGGGVAASGFGLPDIGLVTASETAERVRMIVGVLGDIPLIADADTGYGAPINVVRTVRAYESAGAAAIQLEDQAFPKRCGHLPDKELIAAAAFEQKLAAAVDCRTDENYLVIARTDARASLGLDEAIERGNRYAQAGADIIFVEAPQGTDEIERIAREVDAPLLINLVPGGLTPIESAARLQELGYAIAIHPGTPLAAAIAAMLQALCDFNGRAVAEFLPETPAEFFNLVGMAEWARISEKYQTEDGQPWA